MKLVAEVEEGEARREQKTGSGREGEREALRAESESAADGPLERTDRALTGRQRYTHHTSQTTISIYIFISHVLAFLLLPIILFSLFSIISPIYRFLSIQISKHIIRVA